MASLAIVFRNEKFFSRVLNEANGFANGTNFSKFIKQLAKEKEWGDDLVCLVLSVVIDRPIAFYNLDASQNQVDKIYFVNDRQSCKEPVHLALYLNHYTALLKINKTYSVLHKHQPSNQYEKFELNYETEL